MLQKLRQYIVIEIPICNKCLFQLEHCYLMFTRFITSILSHICLWSWSFHFLPIFIVYGHWIPKHISSKLDASRSKKLIRWRYNDCGLLLSMVIEPRPINRYNSYGPVAQQTCTSAFLLECLIWDTLSMKYSIL